MGFQDILKKSFIQGYMDVNISGRSIALILTTAAIFGLYLFVVYRVVNRRAVYSKSFNVSLVAMAVITAAIIIAIQTSMVISLGMVGALSIVRFRTAIKDPMDLMFLFWSIGVGIMCGAGQFMLCGLLCIGLTVLILVLEGIPVIKAPMILVISMDKTVSEDTLSGILKAHSKFYRIKSRSLMEKLSRMEGLKNLSLLEHSGEVTY